MFILEVMHQNHMDDIHMISSAKYVQFKFKNRRNIRKLKSYGDSEIQREKGRGEGWCCKSKMEHLYFSFSGQILI